VPRGVALGRALFQAGLLQRCRAEEVSAAEVVRTLDGFAAGEALPL
jgi:hypothetical protein